MSGHWWNGTALRRSERFARPSARRGQHVGGRSLLVSIAVHTVLIGLLTVLTARDAPEALWEAMPVYSAILEAEGRERQLRRRVRPVARQAAMARATPTIWQAPEPLSRPAQPVRATLADPAAAVALVPTSLPEGQLPSLAASNLGGPQLAYPTSNGSARSGESRMGDGAFRRPDDTPGLRISVALGNLGEMGGRADAGAATLESPLELIAASLVSSGSEERRRDIVFVLDVSHSMQDNIYAVAKHLTKMADLLEAHNTDFRIGIVTFHEPPWYAVANNSVRIVRPSSDVGRVRRELRRIKCSGGENALNAIMSTLSRIEFRKDADRSLVFVTDEYVDGDYEPRQIYGALYRSQVRVDVIGLDEAFQRGLAARTGGVWIPISSLGS